MKWARTKNVIVSIVLVCPYALNGFLLKPAPVVCRPIGTTTSSKHYWRLHVSLVNHQESAPTSNRTGVIAAYDLENAKDDDSKINIPSVRQLLAFAIPAVGVWLCNPLLSMIDTSTVGLLSGTLQQAALNPAVAVTDYSARTMSFLYVGTTNMIATAGALDRNHHDATSRPITAQRFRGALQLAVLVGSGLGLFLLIFAPLMLRAIIGNDAIDPAVFDAALKYVRIRALGMPAAAVIGTSQAACLGMKDIKSPLLVVATAALVNFCLDLTLVGRPQPWLGGAAGAAWATMFSQYFAMSLFLKWLCEKKDSVPTTPTTTDSMIAPTATVGVPSGRRASIWSWRRPFRQPSKRESSSFITRGFLKGRLFWRDFSFHRLDRNTTQFFKPYVIPVTTTQVGRCSTYIAMGHTVSSSFGTISMAANQIITSIFYALIPIADALSLTAQSHLPDIVAAPTSPERAKALQTTIMNLLKVAGFCGVFLASIVACIPLALHWFTADAAVTALVRRMVPILLVVFSLHGVFCGSEGILLGQRDLQFLGRVYAVYFSVIPYLMLRIKWAAQRGRPVDLVSVWSLFLIYQLFRISVWVSRIVWLQRRENKNANAATKYNSL